MSNLKEEGVCPYCKKKSYITRKWVLNKYKKRYNYVIYHHNGTIHYLNESKDNSRTFRKGEIEKLLVETINSERFKDGLFLTEDIKKLFKKEYSEIQSDTIRANLYRLTKIGMLETVKKGRQVFFLNVVFKERLGYIFDSVKILLGDVEDDTFFRNHVALYQIRNDKTWPLYFLPYRVFGDADTEFREMQFRAFDLSNNEQLKVLLLEDNPREKRVLLRLRDPLFPNEILKVRFEYDWQEPKQAFVFTAATQLKSFEIYLSGNNQLKIQAIQTVSTTNEIKDLASDVSKSRNKKWDFVYSIKLKSIKPFSVIQLKWKRI